MQGKGRCNIGSIWHQAANRGDLQSRKVPKEYTFESIARQLMINQQRQVQREKKSPRYVSDDVKLLETDEFL